MNMSELLKLCNDAPYEELEGRMKELAKRHGEEGYTSAREKAIRELLHSPKDDDKGGK